MTTVLTVQGVELDVSVADWEPVRLGQMARSFSGQARSSVRATKRDHHFHGDAAGMTVVMAEYMRALVEGDGHSWNFEDGTDPTTLLASSRGLPPYVSGTVDSDVGKYGGGAQFNNGEADTKWAVGYDGSDCTLMYWVNTGSGWEHLLVYPGTGAVFSGTTQTDVDPGFFGMSDLAPGADLIAYAETLGTFKADDLVVLPYALPDAWVLPIITFRASSAWAPLPYVMADGAAFPHGAVQCLGQVNTASRVPIRGFGGTLELGEVVDFTMMER